MNRIECIVVGAGVVGLAVARALALRGREVIVLERRHVIGSEVSSRNSGVVHAGLYYPKGSLKARACVAGKQALYDFCASHGVAHARIGKLVVATEDGQLEAMEALIEAGAGKRSRGSRAARSEGGARAGAGGGMRRCVSVTLDRHRRRP